MAAPTVVQHVNPQIPGLNTNVTLTGASDFNSRALDILTFSNGDGAYAATMTLNSADMSILFHQADTPGVEAVVNVGEIQDPGAGTYTIGGTTTAGGGTYYSHDVWEFSGADPILGSGITETSASGLTGKSLDNGGTTPPISVACNGPTGSLVVFGIYFSEGANGTGPTVTDNATLGNVSSAIINTASFIYSGSLITTSDNQAVAFSWTGFGTPGGSIDHAIAFAIVIPPQTATPNITGVTFDSAAANGDIAGGNLTGPTNVALAATGVTSNITSGLATATTGDVTFPANWGNLPFYSTSFNVTLTASGGTSAPFSISAVPVPSGDQVIIADATINTGAYSIFPTGAVSGDQGRIPLLTTGGATIIPDPSSPNSGLLIFDYTAVGSIPSTDSFDVEYWDSVNLIRNAAVTYTITNNVTPPSTSNMKSRFSRLRIGRLR